MKKIAIVTLNGYHNYGNRLQNYAAQEVLKSLGFHVETIIYESREANEKKEEFKIMDRITNLRKKTTEDIIPRVYHKLWKETHKNEIRKRNIKRTEKFKKFTSEYILETNFIIQDHQIPEDLADRYDFFITGSDQVWNPSYSLGSLFYFLTFAPKHKRIAYSPSFGVTKIPTEYLVKYKAILSEMYRLSVREYAGARIIKDLTGLDAPVLIDPTLMLSKEKWLSISKTPEKIFPSNYLLTYFLGDIGSEYIDKIKKIAKENNLKILNLLDIRDLNLYQIDPGEFIGYINRASVFCTDSYHGAVFSILMEIPFIIFDRKSKSSPMHSRIDTLLTIFQMNSRKANNIINNEQIFQVDYSHIALILESERNKSLDYLKEALHVLNDMKV